MTVITDQNMDKDQGNINEIEISGDMTCENHSIHDSTEQNTNIYEISSGDSWNENMNENVTEEKPQETIQGHG